MLLTVADIFQGDIRIYRQLRPINEFSKSVYTIMINSLWMSVLQYIIIMAVYT